MFWLGGNRFAKAAEPIAEAVISANRLVGVNGLREHDASADALLDMMDPYGVDRTLVTSTEALF